MRLQLTRCNAFTRLQAAPQANRRTVGRFYTDSQVKIFARRGLLPMQLKLGSSASNPLFLNA